MRQVRIPLKLQEERTRFCDAGFWMPIRFSHRLHKFAVCDTWMAKHCPQEGDRCTMEFSVGRRRQDAWLVDAFLVSTPCVTGGLASRCHLWVLSPGGRRRVATYVDKGLVKLVKQLQEQWKVDSISIRFE